MCKISKYKLWEMEYDIQYIAMYIMAYYYLHTVIYCVFV